MACYECALSKMMIINNTNPIRILSYKVCVRVCTVTHNQMKSHAWRNTRLMGLNELEPTACKHIAQ